MSCTGRVALHFQIHFYWRISSSTFWWPPWGCFSGPVRVVAVHRISFFFMLGLYAKFSIYLLSFVRNCSGPLNLESNARQGIWHCLVISWPTILPKCLKMSWWLYFSWCWVNSAEQDISAYLCVYCSEETDPLNIHSAFITCSMGGKIEKYLRSKWKMAKVYQVWDKVK